MTPGRVDYQKKWLTPGPKIKDVDVSALPGVEVRVLLMVSLQSSC